MIRVISILLLFFNGVSALYGGWGLISNPSGEKMQMPLELLQHSPFKDYLIPGLILFTVLGIGSIAAAIVSIRRTPHYSLWIIVLGALMAGWILVQILMLQTLHWLHYLYGGTGWALLLLGLIERKILAADPDQENGESKMENGKLEN